MLPLDRLRLRLTAWYAVTFLGILALLGGGLFLTIRHQMSTQLDRSLREAATELMGAARIREMEAQAATGPVVDAVDELHIPDRSLYLLTPDGHPVKPAEAPAWIRDAARAAGGGDPVDLEHEPAGLTPLRVHAQRFTLASGIPMIAAVEADQVELENRYASLIAAFGGAALVALVLVAGGGWLLVRQSTRPIARNVEHMRRFMADAAHELRTPLTVLRSRAEIALQQPREAPAYVAALRGIEAESERLGRIVEDLLTLARADAGEQPIERKRLYLDDLALDASSAAQAVAQGKGVTVSLDEFEEALVEGNAALIHQLVMILLDNAVKFTPAGGQVRVRVSAPEGRATLVVSDTGPGIPAAQLPHVFERFYRGDRTRRPDGAGLGLAIARWITGAHGAEITLTPAPAGGTTATVQFPPVPHEPG